MTCHVPMLISSLHRYTRRLYIATNRRHKLTYRVTEFHPRVGAIHPMTIKSFDKVGSISLKLHFSFSFINRLNKRSRK